MAWLDCENLQASLDLRFSYVLGHLSGNHEFRPTFKLNTFTVNIRAIYHLLDECQTVYPRIACATEQTV